MRVFDIAALLKVSLSVEELLLTMADSKVWENARESGRLDDKVARSVLTGYLAAVDWPANFWHRWLLLLLIKINKTSQECETALTSQYETLFLVFVFLSFFALSFCRLSFCLDITLIKCVKSQKSLFLSKFKSGSE